MMNIGRLILTLFVSLAAATAQADPIAILNPGFEADSPQQNLDASDPSGVITGWYNTGQLNGDRMDLHASNGKGGTQAALTRRTTHQFWQVLSHGWDTGDNFELNFWARPFNTAADIAPVVELFESDLDNGDLSDNPLLWSMTLGDPADTGTDYSLMFSGADFTGGTPGNDIVLGFTGANAYWDDVSLDVTAAAAVPEPASLAIWCVLGLGAIGLCWRFGSRTKRDS